MSPAPPHPELPTDWAPLRIALIYALVSAVWVLVSDDLVAAIFPTEEGLRWATIVLGWVFVAVTAILLFFLVRRHVRRLQERAQSLEQSESQARHLAEIRQVLLRELDHRVKNNLASLYALVDLYQPRSATTEDLASVVREKILAMKWTHEALAGQSDGIELVPLVRAMAEAAAGSTAVFQHLTITGPDLHLHLLQAAPLAMIFHELFSNAHKHGALCSPEGQITLTISPGIAPAPAPGVAAPGVAAPGITAPVSAVPAESGGRRTVILDWRESGIRLRPRPLRPRVGLGLIEGLVRFELAGTAEVEATAQGVHWVLEMNLDPAPEAGTPKQS